MICQQPGLKARAWKSRLSGPGAAALGNDGGLHALLSSDRCSARTPYPWLAAGVPAGHRGRSVRPVRGTALGGRGRTSLSSGVRGAAGRHVGRGHSPGFVATPARLVGVEAAGGAAVPYGRPGVLHGPPCRPSCRTRTARFAEVRSRFRRARLPRRRSAASSRTRGLSGVIIPDLPAIEACVLPRGGRTGWPGRHPDDHSRQPRAGADVRPSPGITLRDISLIIAGLVLAVIALVVSPRGCCRRASCSPA